MHSIVRPFGRRSLWTSTSFVLMSFAFLLSTYSRGSYGQSTSPEDRFVRTPNSSQAIPDARQTKKNTAVVVLELAGEPIAVVRGRAPGKHVPVASEKAIARQLRTKQDALVPLIQAHGAKVLSKLQYALNGIKVLTTEDQIPALSRLPGVVAVRRVQIHTLDNATSVPFIGAPLVWGSTPGLHGEGIKIAILDTGIDYTHANFGGPGTVAAFNAAAAASTVAADPTLFGSGAPKVKGGYDLVGDAYDAGSTDPAHYTPVPDPNPLDCNGHGSHVAGTAAGFGVLANGTTYPGPYDATTPGNTFLIGPGVAPAANIYSFRVFGCSGSTLVVVDALDMAVQANVNVISMSLGSSFGTKDSADSLAATNAEKAGIIVIASAGNAGNIPYITGSPAAADLVISTAAMESHSSFPGVNLALSTGSTLVAQNSNEAIFSDGTSLPIVVLRNGNGTISLGCNESEYQDSVIQGKLVVTARGTCARINRAIFGSKHGAAAVAMINNGAGLPALEGPINGVSIPFIGVLQSDGTAMAGAASATLSNSTNNNPSFRQFASFTSTGPRIGDASLKPDITAPGVSIVSTAMGTGTAGTMFSGTSMAAPHVAGVAALALQAHPTWTADDVRLAIVNTADPTQITSFLPRIGGSGLVQPYPATLTSTDAQGDNGAGSLSLGLAESSADFQPSGNITVHNLSNQPVNFNVTSQPSTGSSPHSVNVSSSLGLSPGGVATLPVSLAVPVATSGDSTAFRDVSGLITLAPATPGDNAGVPLNIPYYFLPRARSKINSTIGSDFGPFRNTSTTAQVTNLSSSITGTADFYEWGLSGSNSSLGSVGLRAVGAKSYASGSGQVLVFAINTFKAWSYAGTKEVDILLDVNGDGLPDYGVFSYDYGLFTTGAYSGQIAAVVHNLATNKYFADYLAVAPDDGSTVLLPVLAASVGLTSGNPRCSYSAESFDRFGSDTDTIAGPARFNAFTNSISTATFASVAPNSSVGVPLSINAAEWPNSPALGVMIVSRDNFSGDQQAQLLPAVTTHPTVNVTVGTAPASLSFSVDGTSYTSAQTFSFDQGSTHTIATSSPQPGTTGVQSVWDNWSDAGAISHSITAPTSDTTYTANFHMEYQLTTGVSSGHGTVSPASGSYFPGGSTVSLLATADAGYVFSTWTGPVANPSSASTTVVMSGPTSVTAQFVAPDFALSGSPGSRTVVQGQATSYTVTITGLAGFNGPVNLNASGLPSGAAGSFSPNPTTNSSTLTVTTAGTTPAGSYLLTITGVSGSLTHTATVTLVVNVPPDFALSAVPTAQTVIRGQSTTFTINITRSGGFADPVGFTLKGLPSGASGFLSPNPSTGAGTVLNVTTTPTTLLGTRTLTITGFNGQLIHSLAVKLTVEKQPTTTTLTSSRTSSTYGDTLTFTATVTSAVGPPPDGETVTFSNGTLAIGSGTLAGGTATFSTTSLNAGPHSIAAAYPGDINLGGSKAVVKVSVLKAGTTTALSVVPSSPHAGDNVTLTATVSSPTGLVPVGSVIFKDGTTVLAASVPLDNTGTATFTTSFTAGTHKLTATYPATTNFTGSASGVVKEVVQP